MADYFPSSALNYENLVQAGAPSVPDYVLNPSQAMDKGIGFFSMDEYNQAAQNSYNNAYNYWLWQQQMEYNSPKSQVARLKEAGLNPNFNSIEGVGNASSIPASTGRVLGNTAATRLNAIGTAVSVVTGVAGAVAKGVQALKTFASTPKAIGFYRSMLSELVGSKFEGSRFDNYLREIELAKRSKLYGVDSDQFGSLTHLSDEAPFWQSLGADIDLKSIRKSLEGKKVEAQDFQNAYLAWRNQMYNPQLLNNMKAQYDNLVAGTRLRNIEIEWKNPKELLGVLGGFVSLLKLVF